MNAARPRVASSLASTLCLWVLGVALATPPATAQQHPNRGRGLDPEGTYQLGDLDHVNLFNGAPVLRIPISQGYPLGGSLSYALTLTYSGNVWDFEERFDGQLYTQALPNRRSNAGLGWLLSLGRIILPTDPTNHTDGRFLYESPDGSDHVLYDNLHNGETPEANVFYSRDGTYLRYKSLVDGGTLEFPDGQIHTFDIQGRLTQIADRFNNYLNISYPVAGTWQLTDQHGRNHFVYFVASVYDTWTQDTLSQIVVTAFNGTTATYDFGVSSPPMSRYCDTDPQTADTVSVPLLTSISLPDGSSYSIATTDYDLGDGVACSDASGQLRGITLPTLGRLEWDYATWVYPTSSGSCTDFFARSNGILKRRLRNASGVVEGEWTYTPTLDVPDGCTNVDSRELRVRVDDPLGHRKDHFFSVSLIDIGAWNAGEYGMPLTHHVTDATGTRFPSNRTYASGVTLVRSEFVRYDFDAAAGTTPPYDLYDGNRRVQSSRTVFDDDAGRFADTDLSNFDGLGHYRQTDTNGNFEAGNVRSAFTNFNPTRGTFPGTFVMVLSTEPWVLGTFSEQTATEAGMTSKSEFCFDSATGFLDRARTLKTGTTRGANDLLAVYTRDASGNLIRERYFGGDTQSLDLSGDCAFALPTDQYRIDHTYQYGSLQTSQYHDAAGQPLSFKSVDRGNIDLNTGLARASRDTSGIQTDFEYDSMGRLRHVKPALGHDGWTEFVYTRATSPSSLARTNVYRRPNGGGVTILAQSETRLDSFGRLSEERVLMADGTWSSQLTTYNGKGLRSAVSELGATSSLTQYLNYDPFDRPGIMRPPDGSAHDVTFVYFGNREVRRTVKVGTSESGGIITETPVTKTEVYDRQGRLSQSWGAGTLLATHGYDVGNRLKSVVLSDGLTIQNRFFTYDNRGFLTSEQHPEKGVSGNGTVTYFNYDARGHAGRKVDGPNDLTTTYDRAERVTRVRKTGGEELKEFTYGTSNAISVWDNGKVKTADRYNYQTIGGSPYIVRIGETNFYGSRQGRLSQRDTAIAFEGQPPWASFTQSWFYNDLGEIDTIGYPDCTHSPCATQVPDPDPVSFTYTNGFLTSVPNLVSSITYHPNGMVAGVSHTNGVAESHLADPNGMSRPSLIESRFGAQLLWSSGTYQYDGMGNVVKMGNAVSLYDSVGRLVSNKVFLGPTGGGVQVTQTYSYDAFGNIQAIGGNSARNTPTNQITNRLTGGGYDAAGNLTSWSGNAYEYDQLSNMSRMVSGGENWYYFYNADNERIWMWKYTVSSNFNRFELRGLDAQVLASYIEEGGFYSRERQNVFRDSTLSSAKTPTGWTALAVDHLGTPRSITNSTGGPSAYHAYYGFGEEATAFDQDSERMKLTGHQRDLASPSGPGDDLDYMHARHYNFWTGRFMSTDPASCGPENPQRWNRYAYVLNRPLTLIDPTGLDDEDPYKPDEEDWPPDWISFTPEYGGGGGWPPLLGSRQPCGPREKEACEENCKRRGGMVRCEIAKRERGLIFVDCLCRDPRPTPPPTAPPTPPPTPTQFEKCQEQFRKCMKFYNGDPVTKRKCEDDFKRCLGYRLP